MSIDATLLGYIAAFCTTFAFIPQVIQTLRTQNTESISLGMYSLLVFGIFLWLIYGLLVKDFPIIVANGVTLSLASTILSLKIKHTLAKRSTRELKPES